MRLECGSASLSLFHSPFANKGDIMQIKMTQNAFGMANANGNESKEYKEGEIVKCDAEWQKNLATVFVENGFAMEIKVSEPTEKKASKKVAKKKATKKK